MVIAFNLQLQLLIKFPILIPRSGLPFFANFSFLSKVLVIGEEEVLPYMRPPLSKELWFTDKKDTADTLIFNSWDGKERR